MIKIDSVLDYLRKAKEGQEFDEIFNAVKNDLPTIYETDEETKAELWNGLLSSIEIIRISNTKFDLAERYSQEEIKRIHNLNEASEEIEKEEEE